MPAPKMIRVRAVGEGEAAYSCPRPGGAIKNGSRFIGRDRAGAVVPEGEEVAWSLHVHDLLAQGQLVEIPAAPAAAAPAARRAKDGE